MRIYIVRHGETDWNKKFLFQGHTDTELNKNGINQAKRIAKFFKDKKIDIIISSDLKRAFETAKIIKSSINYKGKIIKNHKLRERDYGELEGKKYELLFKNKNFKGEKESSFIKRVKDVLKDIINEYKNKNVLIVTHGGVLRVIIASILKLKNFKVLRVYNASISEVIYDPEKKAFFLTLFNQIEHLSKKDKEKEYFFIKGI